MFLKTPEQFFCFQWVSLQFMQCIQHNYEISRRPDP